MTFATIQFNDIIQVGIPREDVMQNEIDTFNSLGKCQIGVNLRSVLDLLDGFALSHQLFAVRVDLSFAVNECTHTLKREPPRRVRNSNINIACKFL